jgi:hypothetical protein
MNNCSLSPWHIARLLEVGGHPLKVAYDKSKAERMKRDAEIEAMVTEARGIAAEGRRRDMKRDKERDKMFYVLQSIFLVASIVSVINLIFVLF